MKLLIFNKKSVIYKIFYKMMFKLNSIYKKNCAREFKTNTNNKMNKFNNYYKNKENKMRKYISQSQTLFNKSNYYNSKILNYLKILIKFKIIQMILKNWSKKLICKPMKLSKEKLSYRSNCNKLTRLKWTKNLLKKKEISLSRITRC